MDFRKKRWVSYGAALLIALAAGFMYSISVFQIPLSQRHGWTIPQVAFAYSVLSIAEIVAVLFFTAKLKHKLGLKKFMVLGGLLFGGGVFLTGIIRGSLFELYLYQGIMIGVGNAIVYPTLTSYVIQIIPERSGLASGLVIALYAMGPVIWAPMSAFMTENTGDVALSSRIIGLFLLIIFIIGALLLTEPPKDFLELAETADDADNTDNKTQRKVQPVYDVPHRKMLRKPLFYIFYATFAISITLGTMMLTQGATIIEGSTNLSPTEVATIFGFLSVGNAAGRIISGALSDKIGSTSSTKLFYAAYIVGFAMLIFIPQTSAFVVAIALIYTSFGGFSALLAPLTSELFGVRNVTANYNYVFTIYSVGGFLSPVIVSNLQAMTGNYDAVFWLGLIFSVVGLALGLYMIQQMNRIRTEHDVLESQYL